MNTMSRANFGPNVMAPRGNPMLLTPDIEQTATNICDARLDGRRYPPYNIVKNSVDEFREMIERVGRQVGRTRLRLTPEQLDDNRVFFETHDTALAQVKLLRAADHTPHLMELLVPRLFDLEIVLDPLPDDPISHEKMNVINWRETYDANSHVFEGEQKIRQILDDIYGTDTLVNDDKARDHFLVIESFEQAANMAAGISCGTF